MRWLLLVLLLLCAPPLLAQGGPPPKEAPPAKADVLKAIEAFKADPLSPPPNANFTTVLMFAEGSPEVELEIGPKTCPWVGEEPKSQWQGYLLAAYLVGNVEAQLKAGKAGDQVAAGHAAVRATYALIQKKDPAYKSAAVDKLPK